MRAVKSWGLAIILVVIIGVWMATGTLVQGGKGPHDGEITVAQALDGGDGPVTGMVNATGMAKEPHHEEGVDDPALSIAERTALAGTGDAAPRSVRTRRFEISEMPLDVTLRGYTSAYAKVDASVRTSDIVRAVAVRVGQSVQAGDLICSLEKGTRAAAVEQARAAVMQADASLRQAQADFQTNEALRKRGIASANSAEGVAAALSSAEANQEAAAVALRNSEVELENTEIRATVPGIVQRPVAKVGDLLNAGESCATIIQLDPMEFIGAIPQAHVGLARVNLEAQIRTITGITATGAVKYISSSADPATRTFEVEIEFPNPDRAVLDGQTAEATVSLGSVPAHLVPQSIMTLDPDGRLGVRAVLDGKVVFYALEIIRDTREGAWVRGLPQIADVIVIGQDYVTAGQTVTATLEQ